MLAMDEQPTHSNPREPGVSLPSNTDDHVVGTTPNRGNLTGLQAYAMIAATSGSTLLNVRSILIICVLRKIILSTCPGILKRGSHSGRPIDRKRFELHAIRSVLAVASIQVGL